MRYGLNPGPPIQNCPLICIRCGSKNNSKTGYVEALINGKRPGRLDFRVVCDGNMTSRITTIAEVRNPSLENLKAKHLFDRKSPRRCWKRLDH